jgi:hypothetical protein
MGWLYYYRPPGETDVAHFRAKFTDGYELLDGMTLRAPIGSGYQSVLYGALREKRTGHVEAFVALLNRGRSQYTGDANFGYKDMTETMGPAERECPRRILEMLTPLDVIFAGEDPETNSSYRWAREWREACWANVRKRESRTTAKKGDTLKFAQPLEFANGDTLDTLVLVDARRNQFARPGREFSPAYRISRWRDREFEVVAA